MNRPVPGPGDRPWRGDRVVSPGRARELIAAQFPDLRPVRVDAYGAGWDNTAFRVNQRYVFRFPRREEGALTMAAELTQLPRLQELPLTVPRPEFLGRPVGEYPWPWAGYRELPGVPLYRANPDEALRETLAEPMGRFIHALHETPAEEELPGDLWGRFDFDKRTAQIQSYLQQLQSLGLLARPGAYREVLEAVERVPRPDRRVCAHGDLDGRHWLIQDGRLSGVIDWGDVHRGVPAVDLLAPWLILPPAARDRFWKAYGEATDSLVAWSRFRALNQAVVTASYGVEIHDDHLVRESLAALERIRMA